MFGSMNKIRNDRHKLDDWLAVQAGQANWDKIYQHYQATTDFPGCVYYEELRSHYPDAKVSLTVRAPEQWYQSVYETIYQSFSWCSCSYRSALSKHERLPTNEADSAKYDGPIQKHQDRCFCHFRYGDPRHLCTCWVTPLTWAARVSNPDFWIPITSSAQM